MKPQYPISLEDYIADLARDGAMLRVAEIATSTIAVANETEIAYFFWNATECKYLMTYRDRK